MIWSRELRAAPEMVQMTPGSKLAGIGCKSALKIPTDIARGSRESRDEIGVARGERVIAGESGLRRRRPWGRESQLIEAFTKSVFECHGGQIVRDGEHTGLISSASHNESAVSLYQDGGWTVRGLKRQR